MLFVAGGIESYWQASREDWRENIVFVILQLFMYLRMQEKSMETMKYM